MIADVDGDVENDRLVVTQSPGPAQGDVVRFLAFNHLRDHLAADGGHQSVKQPCAEGLLVGGSSGSAVWASLQVCRDLGPGKRVVVILPDSIRNYLTKFVDDRWMRQQGFFKADWEVGTVGDVMRNYSDTSKAHRRLGWNARVGLDDGLDRTVKWFLQRR